jgi:hypothetical protein
MKRAILSTFDVFAVLKSEGAPLSHLDIADRLEAPPWRVAIALSYLRRRGHVDCIGRARRGKITNDSQWNITESGMKWAGRYTRDTD